MMLKLINHPIIKTEAAFLSAASVYSIPFPYKIAFAPGILRSTLAAA